MNISESPNSWSARFPLSVGAGAILLLLGSIGYWSLNTQIAGAIVASGTIKVEFDRQIVQHQDGGVVAQIKARDGDAVMSGDVVVRFDDTFWRSELTIVNRQLLEIYARVVRLRAEGDASSVLIFHALDEFDRLDSTWVRGQIDGQRNLFDARLSSLHQERAQLAEQRLQIESQIVGIAAQHAAQVRQFELIAQELNDQEALQRKGLVPIARILELQREKARLGGDIGRPAGASAVAKGKISGIAIAILKLADRRREDAISRLRDLRFREIELVERQATLHERLARMVVTAPVSGIIFGSNILALKSVVRAAEPMMYYVPADQPLHVLARIDPIYIDQVYSGQRATLKFPTFDQRTTPEISGQVIRLSPDTVTDEKTGAKYYEAVVVPSDITVGVTDVSLHPGMPVEVFLKTNERTPMAYLLKPLTHYFDRAFREG